MPNGSELKSPAAKALRAAGYKPCPRWWLTEEQMELLAYMARQNADDVNRIRCEANATQAVAQQIDAAWEQWRNTREEVEAETDHSRGTEEGTTDGPSGQARGETSTDTEI